VGFKLFYYHAHEGRGASVWSYLQDRRDLKILHLKRWNVLQTHLSRKRAALTGQWVSTSDRADAAPPVRLEYQECVNDFVQTRAWESEYDRFFAAHQMLSVQYERLSDAHAPEMQRIEAFLGVSLRPVQPSTFRQTRQRLEDAISNYAELKERFAGTPWEGFFVE